MAASFVPAGIFTDEKMGCWVGCWVSVQLEMSTALVAGVVELDERVRRVGGAGADAEFVDLDRADVPHLLGRRLGLRPRRSAVHEALPTRSPLKAAGPEVTLKVALTLAPGATGSANVFAVSVVPETTAVHPAGTAMLNLTSVTGAPVVFVNVTVVSCDEPGENVWSPGGVATADAGARLSRGTSYPAATTLACTIWSVASVGKVPAAVIAPS